MRVTLQFPARQSQRTRGPARLAAALGGLGCALRVVAPRMVGELTITGLRTNIL